MTCIVGEGIVVCTSDPWRVGYALCPWCCLPGDQPVRHLVALVYGGWCGSDLLCGTCGQFWSSDMDRLRATPNDEREENIAKVAAKADPSCWTCHDSGWIESPIAEPVQCNHQRGKEAYR